MIIRTVRHIIAIGAALGIVHGGLESCSSVFAPKGSAATRSEHIDTVGTHSACPRQLLAVVGSQVRCNIRWPFVPPSDGSGESEEHAGARSMNIGFRAQPVPEAAINANAGGTQERRSDPAGRIGHGPSDRLTPRTADERAKQARPVAGYQASASERAANRIAREQAARDRVAAERIARQQEEVNRREVERIQREQAEINQRVSVRIALEQTLRDRLAVERITRQEEAANQRTIEAILRRQLASSLDKGAKEPATERAKEPPVRRSRRFSRVLRKARSILRSTPLLP